MTEVDSGKVTGLREVSLGPLTAHWLPLDVAIDAEVYADELTAEDLAQAQSLRAAARNLEFLRSRLVCRRLTGWRGPLPRAPDGVITWPPGVVGSITHKSGHVAVAFGATSKFRSIGIDVEDLGRMKAEFEPRLATPAESALLRDVARTTGRDVLQWLAVLFSYKETLFKSHYPLGRAMFYFLDAALEAIEPQDDVCGRLRARLLVPVSPAGTAGSSWEGHYRFENSGAMTLVFTGATVSADR